MKIIVTVLVIAVVALLLEVNYLLDLIGKMESDHRADMRMVQHDLMQMDQNMEAISILIQDEKAEIVELWKEARAAKATADHVSRDFYGDVGEKA